MKFIETRIPDVWLIEPKVLGDSRGYFFESFREDEFVKNTGFEISFIQENESKSQIGVFRGLHFQIPPLTQSKLVRVIEGSVLDVAVDIRKGSPTFGQHFQVELSGENKRQLFIPRGFAHGFLVTSETAIFSYKVDNYYSPEFDRGIFYDDPEVGIQWNISRDEIQLSEKDKNLPLLKDAEVFSYTQKLY